MDALLRINKHFGITVVCNLHSLDLARSYCDRLIGMAAGRVVFDGAPATLTDHIARELYDLEADEVMGAAPAQAPDRFDAFRLSARSPRPERCVCKSCSCADCRSASVITAKTGDVMINRRIDSRRCGGTGIHRPPPPRRRTGRRNIPNWFSPRCPDENASGVTDRWTPFVGLSVQANSAPRSRCASPTTTPPSSKASAPAISTSRCYGPASYARAYITGVKVEPFAIEMNGDGTKGYYSVLYVKSDAALQEHRGSQGQESLPGRSELDLGQQRAALRDWTRWASPTPTAILGKVVYAGSHENAMIGAVRRAPSMSASN